MSTQPPVECPLCHKDLPENQNVDEHLIEDHSKEELAEFVVSEPNASSGDIS
ncbi:hypothetical protein [Natrinema sp. DC36]|uniref:hypothetical protein n=1 Tax=Natrinema sp. DC36 TaxID=2878680 RepID=UPI001CF0C280|nr:hypothetical protein [Natrinema sp. DC36]